MAMHALTCEEQPRFSVSVVVVVVVVFLAKPKRKHYCLIPCAPFVMWRHVNYSPMEPRHVTQGHALRTGAQFIAVENRGFSFLKE
ncbi:unnamed protein product [Sphenostylis stenocarpa]|uniref:Uncharacterized protein n=1 Tax=Sphenostylis stenocarpa TaxID=92480 RepID=A0AA86W041_9FABA|nr:unnamed protein product [Sphenostylis stenocarpa]